MVRPAQKDRILPNASISLSSGGNRVFMQILDYCKNLMAQGQLKSGDRLLPERGLSERLGVSRASLRDALRTMEMLDLLSVIPGHGTYIQPSNLKFLATFFGLAFSIRSAILENIFEVRIMLTCEAARLASKRFSQEELASIKSALDRMPRNSTERLNRKENIWVLPAVFRVSPQRIPECPADIPSRSALSMNKEAT